MPTIIFPRTVACLFGIAALVATVQAADVIPADDAPDLTKVRAAIQAKQYSAALTELKSIVVDISSPTSTACWVSRCARRATVHRR